MFAAGTPPRIWGIHDAISALDPRPSGCGYYRICLPFDQLLAHGWDGGYKAGSPPPEANTAHLIVGERLDRPDVQGHWRRLILRHRLVYELDDDVFNVSPLNRGAYWTYGRPSVQDTIAHLAAVSHLVTVSTPHLAEVMAKYNPNVAVLPNYIPAEMLSIERPRRKGLTIGWTGGASHTLDVAMIAEPVRTFLNHNPKARLHIQGSDFRPTFGHLGTRYTEWEPNPRKYYRLLDFDIGLAPLTGSFFDASKSHIKALEYAALGIPVIASDVEAYRGFVIDGVTGFLVKTPKQWRARLRELAADANLRESMGAKAKEHARNYTIEEHWTEWAQAYGKVLGLSSWPGR